VGKMTDQIAYFESQKRRNEDRLTLVEAGCVRLFEVDATSGEVGVDVTEQLREFLSDSIRDYALAASLLRDLNATLPAETKGNS
jgi:hypothetical protein